MPGDYDYNATAPNNSQNNSNNSFGSGIGSAGHPNPFNAPQRNSVTGKPNSSQSPFVNAQQRSVPQTGMNARGFVPIELQKAPQASIPDYPQGQTQGYPQDQTQGYPQDQTPPPGNSNHSRLQGGSFVHGSDTYREGYSTQPANDSESWSGEFDGFSRISQQQSMFNARRRVADIFTDEQLQLYDRNQFAELHYLLQTELKRNPKSLNALIGVALCNLSIGEPQKSAEYFAKATDIDESVRPSKYLNEVPSGDPDDWLDMAEELGHYGMIDGSMELCSSIVDSNQFSDRVRRQAMKVREVIQQDYFAARERIIIGNNTDKKNDNMRGNRLLSALTFIVLPLCLAVVMGGWLFYSINMNNGKVSLGQAVYRLDHLKRGDTAVERMGSCDNNIIDAQEYFNTAIKFNPFTKEAYFYTMQATLLSKELGRVRSKSDNTKWSNERWQQVKADYAAAKTAYDALDVSTEKDLAFKAEWQEFVAESKKGDKFAI